MRGKNLAGVMGMENLLSVLTELHQGPGESYITSYLPQSSPNLWCHSHLTKKRNSNVLLDNIRAPYQELVRWGDVRILSRFCDSVMCVNLTLDILNSPYTITMLTYPIINVPVLNTSNCIGGIRFALKSSDEWKITLDSHNCFLLSRSYFTGREINF